MVATIIPVCSSSVLQVNTSIISFIPDPVSTNAIIHPSLHHCYILFMFFLEYHHYPLSWLQHQYHPSYNISSTINIIQYILQYIVQLRLLKNIKKIMTTIFFLVSPIILHNFILHLYINNNEEKNNPSLCCPKHWLKYYYTGFFQKPFAYWYYFSHLLTYIS